MTLLSYLLEDADDDDDYTTDHSPRCSGWADHVHLSCRCIKFHDGSKLLCSDHWTEDSWEKGHGKLEDLNV